MTPATGTPSKLLLRSLRGETLERPPIWLMRQAGRYLPEYRATRAKAGGFLDLCYNPELAEEVTLQPIRRFGFDAAILFADILLLPQALGQKLWFEPGEGPRLTPIQSVGELKLADEVDGVLNPIYETVRRLKSSLPAETTLIGFAGAPWTVATYMVAGRGTPDQGPAHDLMAKDPEGFDAILDRVADGTIHYLSKQIEAGAEVVKIFDSWAGSLKGEAFERACIKPCLKIVEGIRRAHPNVPIIGFPRGAGKRALSFVKATGVEGVAIEEDMDILWARDALQQEATVQGNLHPRHMIEGGDGLRQAVEHLLTTLNNGPYIFNLGHGITPEASPDHVETLIRLVKG
ncbi:MAG: uroporphyrinogen decarboxylase [Pseudomonadota bacterium]